MMPLPQAPCASATVGLTRTRPEIGLRQPIETIKLGEGCTATLCGFMRPGTSTSRSDELAIRDGVSSNPHPWMKSYPLPRGIFLAK